jgi:hypothetical protein
MQFDQLKRREFIMLLGAAAAWPLAGRAQQPERKRRIGVLMAHAENDAEFHDYLARSARDSRSWGGRKVATFKSILAGVRSMMLKLGNDPQKN